MTETSDKSGMNVELQYKEYARLGALVDHHVSASFSDFRLYGSVAAIAIWYPAAKALKDFLPVAEPTLVFGGFVAIAFLIAILASRDMYRQSFSFFYLSQMVKLEKAITANGTQQVLSLADDWKDWEERVASIPGRPLVALFIVFLIAFPTIVLLFAGLWYSVAYAVLTTILTGLLRFTQRRFDEERKR